MSGHSHAKTVKHQKELDAKKRGNAFSKLTRLISVAVREGGSNPENNPKLKLAFETAKKWNMPKDNIERAISRASGETSAENFEEVIFEGFGPAGIAVIIEGITDNKNRTLGEIRQILNQNQGKLAGEGAVRWMFERKVEEPGSLAWIAKQEIEVPEKDKEAAKKLFEALDENDSVQRVFNNLKM